MNSENNISPQMFENLQKVIQEAVVNTLSDQKMLSAALRSVKNEKTIAECVCEYRNHLAEMSYSVKYQKSVKATLQNQIQYLGSEKKLSTITNRDIEKFVLFRKQSSPKGFRVDWRNAKAFFSKLVFWGYLSENPTAKLKFRQDQKQTPAYLIRTELDFVNTFVNSSVLRSLYLFTYFTGLRASEVCNLDWNSVNLLEKYIIIGSKNFITKSRKQRIIPLCNEAVAILKSLFPKIINKNSHHVFCKMDGSKYSTDYISKTFKHAVRKAKLSQEIHLHTLRHSCATRLVQAGVPLINVKEILGHSSISTTEIYSHYSMDNLRSAVAVFDKRKEEKVVNG